MLAIATGLFGVTVLAGIWMGVIHMDSDGRRRPPLWLAVAHGIFAVVAAVPLVAVLERSPTRGLATGSASFGVIAAGFFLGAAAVGSYLFFARHLRGRRLPGVAIVTHMMLAVTGFVVLVVYLSFP